LPDDLTNMTIVYNLAGALETAAETSHQRVLSNLTTLQYGAFSTTLGESIPEACAARLFHPHTNNFALLFSMPDRHRSMPAFILTEDVQRNTSLFCP